MTGISYKLKTEILPFLLSNRIALLELAEKPHQSVAAIFQLKGLDALIDALIHIGFSLALRSLLLEGLQSSLREAGGTAAVQLGVVAGTALGCVHQRGNRKLSAPLASLATSAGSGVGTIGGRKASGSAFSRLACHSNGSVAVGGGGSSANPADDAALCLALEGGIQGQHEHDALVLLPVACAAAFAARSWSAAGGAAVAASSGPDEDNYTVFESNHHCVPLAVATLFSVLFGADAPTRGSGAVYDSHAAFERVEEPARLLRHMSSEYLYLSAQVSFYLSSF